MPPSTKVASPVAGRSAGHWTQPEPSTVLPAVEGTAVEGTAVDGTAARTRKIASRLGIPARRVSRRSMEYLSKSFPPVSRLFRQALDWAWHRPSFTVLGVAFATSGSLADRWVSVSDQPKPQGLVDSIEPSALSRFNLGVVGFARIPVQHGISGEIHYVAANAHPHCKSGCSTRWLPKNLGVTGETVRSNERHFSPREQGKAPSQRAI